MIAIIGDYYIQHNLEDITNCKRKPPWIWMSDPQVLFNLMIIDKQIVGFYIARLSHLIIIYIHFLFHKDLEVRLRRKLLQEH